MGRLLIILTLLVSTQVLAQTTVTITASQDNTIYTDLNGVRSNGSGAHLFAGLTAQGETRRALIAFKDLSAIPSDATIESVKLIIFVNRTAADAVTFQVNRLTSDWGEGTSDAPMFEGQGAAPTAGDATWTHAIYPDTNWNSPGGDFVSSASATMEIDDFAVSYTIGSTAALVSDVQGWLDNPGSNFGWIIRADEDVRSAKRFGSRNGTFEANFPRIEVEYSGGSGGGGGGGFEIDAGINGNWWNGPARNGEGAQVEVADNGNGGLVFVATVYSYDPEGNQIFLIAVGTVEGDTVTADVFISQGGVWGDDFDPKNVTQPEWGTATFTAVSCDLLQMSLEPNAEFQAQGYTDLAYDLIPLTTRLIPCGGESN